MRVDHLSCGAFANVSEETAFRAVNRHLLALPIEGRAFVLTNLAHGVGRGGQPDEIDMIVISSGGAVVIEVKHWDRTRWKGNAWEVEDQADLITLKAKRVAGRLRQVQSNLGFVPAKMLLTKEGKTLRQEGELPRFRGVRMHGLADLDALLSEAIGASNIALDVEALARELAPRGMAAATGDLKRLGRIGELKRLTGPEDRFRRVYAGRDTGSGDRVTLHLYDLSAVSTANAEQLARREFVAVQRLQKSPYLPILVDSFQPCPGYPGELCFFTLAESAAASAAELANDPAWTTPARLAFAAAALRALAELHTPSTPDGQAPVHRGLTPESVRVRADGKPLFAGWRWARLPEAKTITGPDGPAAQDDYAAPEVRQNGLAFADTRSDVYSLCKVLQGVFTDADAEAARAVLAEGMAEDPSSRAAPASIAEALEALAQPPESHAQPDPPPPAAAQHWDAGHVVEWADERYRVVSRLGEGGAGRTFKLEQLGSAGEPMGVFVGKVVLNPEVGPDALEAYRKVRSIADHRCLCGVYQTASDWSPDKLIALLKWRKGEPLDGWRGEYLTLVAEEMNRSGPREPEALLLQWAEDLCEALEVLHAQGWVHGDVSPSNIIFEQEAVSLIDFDLACRVGTVALSPGTAPYASPGRRTHQPATPSDDVFALAASLFHVLTDRLPFVRDGVHRDDEGLVWLDGERQRYPKLAAFLDRAVDPDPARRFESAGVALTLLRELRTPKRSADRSAVEPAPHAPEPLRPNTVPRVKEIQRAYPGSRFGNAETRGLDSEFAHDTYVETELDCLLPETIRAGEVSLVILCGNAGDGKTAFLQHLAAQLGVKELPSERRVWDGVVDGVPIKINLDGAAAWRGRSADELLDELFQPFHDGPPKTRRVHLLAVNDGRLMEWLESYEARHYETRLTRDLAEALEREGDGLDPHIRLIELNLRSLVGGIDDAKGEITAEFVDRLCAQLVGGDKAAELWQACHTCSARARCSIHTVAEMIGVSTNEAVLRQGALLRRRLAAAFQAVHQRNEVHITARELKAALSYILFGIHACEDLHENVDLAPHVPADAAFDPRSPLRQGELLRELTRLDPALEAHARIDRYLISRAAPDPAHGAPRYPDASLASARRRAYLDWTDDQIARVGGDAAVLGLNGGRHFAKFRDFPLLPPESRRAIRDAVCRGLSRLEELPEIAHRQASEIPIRVVPRTLTETKFWVGKPLDQFALEAEQFLATPGLTTLHRYLRLSYRTSNGRTEQLTISLELFGLLMDLSEGLQIIDAFSDDVFANLGVFTQRLAQEDERSLYAWTPAADDRVLDTSIERRDGVQTIVLRPAPGEAA